jgi:hypothetical protein
MRKRKLRWAIVGLALALVLAVGAFAPWPRPDRITKENCDRIRKGMSRAEVYALLGPPGDHRTVDTVMPIDSNRAFTHMVPKLYDNLFSRWEVEELTWLGDEGNIHVYLGTGGVVNNCFTFMDKLDQNPLDNLLWRSKRQWREWFPEKP